MEDIQTITKIGLVNEIPAITPDMLSNIKSNTSNWVIPGRIMCGPFPGLDGFNCMDESAAITNLKAILDDGIDTFVCLQHEIPADIMQNVVHPHFRKYEHYVRTVRDRIKPVNANSLQYIHFPLVDQSIPDKKEFIKQMAVLCNLYMEGRKIYIHCAGGHGRTGLYVACLFLCLSRRKSLNPEDIIAFVQHAHDRRRQQDKRCDGHLFVRSPNTNQQREFVKEWAQFLSFL